MSIIKKIPWLSLTLALLTYSSLGWFISVINLDPIAWIGVAIALLLVVAIMTMPLLEFNKYTNYLFKSNIRTFVAAIFGALLLFLMLGWFRLFLDTLVIVAANILVRIDFQTAGWQQIHAFGILSLIALSGLGIGSLLHRLMST
ncbi:hypothetical protein [Calothrix sp. UHCC 0171]|uniref:hypothetical protein n=1 Tax=Calothrix sp. UHCC 0171 TaxID=3110245 RepID=UPI002B1F8E5C|nr:hypothetical protein [Calothrix sp. UHCC 0171]MEA5573127.1 hypothetical protein [Calothrix sp. UHCC 0171]